MRGSDGRAPTRRPSLAGSIVTRMCALVPALGVLAERSPLVAIGATGMTFVGIAALTAPIAFVGAAAFMSAAVPKAGFLAGGLPLPVMMFVLLLAAVLLRQLGTTPAGHRPGARLAAAALAWLGFRLLAVAFDGGSLADVLALAGWFGLPLILLLMGPPISGLRGPIGRLWTTRLELGVIAACLFGAVQQLVGIEETAVPGITRSVGADYATKPLAFEGGSKIPSTYQNGNLLGVVTAFFFLIAADRVMRGRGGRRDIVVMLLTAIATVLSGSRTVLIGLAVGLGFLILRSGLRRQIVVVCAVAAFAVAGVLQLSPALAARITGTTTSDPALEVRTRVWSAVLDTSAVTELLTGGTSWARPAEGIGLAEGVIGAVQQVGLLGVGLLIAAMVAATNAPALRRWRLLLIPVAISFAVDSAYLVFPTLFLPLARMFSPVDESEVPPERNEDVRSVNDDTLSVTASRI